MKWQTTAEGWDEAFLKPIYEKGLVSRKYK